MTDFVATPPGPPAAPAPGLSGGLVWLLVLTCGLVAANLYYSQPLLAAIGHTFHVSDSQASLVATSLRPEASSRLNTVYMTAYFAGSSLGSVVGGVAWAGQGYAQRAASLACWH